MSETLQVVVEILRQTVAKSIEPLPSGQILLCHSDNISNSINKYSMQENRNKIQMINFDAS